MSTKIHRKSFHILTCSVVIAVISIAFIVNGAIVALNKSADDYKSRLENSYRADLREELIEYGMEVENDIDSTTTSSEIYNISPSIFSKYLDNLDYRPAVKDIIVLNLGYEIQTDYSDAINELCKKYPNLNKQEFKNSLQTIFDNLQSGSFSGIYDLSSMIDSYLNKIPNLNVTEEANINKDIFGVIFQKNHIVLRSSNGLAKDKTIEEIQNDNNYWVEWITIPHGYLGLDKEPYVKNGDENLLYKKYVVMVVVDKDVVLANYNAYMNRVEFIEDMLIVFVILLASITILISIIQFYKFINGGGDVEPIIIRKNTNTDSDCTDKLLSRIYDRIKSLRNR